MKKFKENKKYVFCDLTFCDKEKIITQFIIIFSERLKLDLFFLNILNLAFFFIIALSCHIMLNANELRYA